MNYQIIEGKQIEGQNGFPEWDFGFNTWSSPVFYKIEADHPDGPEGYRHPYWNDGRDLAAGFVASVDVAEAIVKRWDPVRRRRYLSQERIFWSGYGDWIHKRGWLTPAGRRKYLSVDERDGHPFGALALVDSDFRHGITQEQLYWVTKYRNGGSSFENRHDDVRLLRLKEYHAEMQTVKAHLENTKDTCPLIYAEYMVYKNIFLEQRPNKFKGGS